jgi:hypothetical protein
MPAEPDTLPNHLRPGDRRLIIAAISLMGISVAVAGLFANMAHLSPCHTYRRAGFTGSETVRVCDNRRKRLTSTVPTLNLKTPMQRSPNAWKTPYSAFVAGTHLR